MPVYTIGFEEGDAQELEYLVSSTGATFFSAESLGTTQAYDSIQTNIRFQYVADVTSKLVTPYSVTLFIDLNGDGVNEASRTLTENESLTGVWFSRQRSPSGEHDGMHQSETDCSSLSRDRKRWLSPNGPLLLRAQDHARG